MVFQRPAVTTPPPHIVTVAGVVEDTDTDGIGRRLTGLLYVPFEQDFETTMAIVVRSSNPSETAAALPELIRRADAGVAVHDVGTGVSLSGIANVPLRIVAGLTGLSGGVALVVAMTGLYGILTFLVNGRRREIGVRRALGATTSTVVHMIVADGLRPVLLGLCVGLAASALLRAALTRFIRLVATVDPLLVVVLSAVFVSAGLLACALPALRATSVDPSVALRDL
jgi:putative ABC transport system permease protein